MTIIKSHRLLYTAFTFVFIFTVTAAYVDAQRPAMAPDLTVSGMRLGDRVSGKAFLENFQPRTDGGRPTYYFYDKYAATVMKVTAASFDDPYFVTEVEVFAVDESYRNRHFYLDKVGFFETESGIFIGTRQSARGIKMTMIFGSPIPLGMMSNGLKDILRKKGEPTERNKSGKDETMDYKIEAIDIGGESPTKYGYEARYEFNSRRLQRYSMKILPRKI
jgi:hypothetical protein